jgi:hypothetical protein
MLWLFEGNRSTFWDGDDQLLTCRPRTAWRRTCHYPLRSHILKFIYRLLNRTSFLSKRWFFGDLKRLSYRPTCLIPGCSPSSKRGVLRADTQPSLLTWVRRAKWSSPWHFRRFCQKSRGRTAPWGSCKLTRCGALQDDHGFVGRFAHSLFTESYWYESPIGDYFFKKRFERNNIGHFCHIVPLLRRNEKGRLRLTRKRYAQPRTAFGRTTTMPIMFCLLQ